MKKIITILLVVITTTLFAQSSIVKQIGEFTEVKVFDLINVTMIKSDKNEVVIDGSNKRNVQVINKNGKLKIISFFAKKARGLMTRHLLDTKAASLKDVLAFAADGYAYSEAATTDVTSPVFVR